MSARLGHNARLPLPASDSGPRQPARDRAGAAASARKRPENATSALRSPFVPRRPRLASKKSCTHSTRMPPVTGL